MGDVVAQHVESSSLDGSATAKTGRKNKKGKPKESLEEKARLAEEALLQELEKEDAQAKVEEAKANSKQAKKKKKKERERFQKMKEDDERRLQQEQEAFERENIRKQKEELLRKERDELQKERDIKYMLEREKLMASQRREREEREKIERAQNSQGLRGSGSVSPTELRSSTVARGKHTRATTDPTPKRKIVTPKGGTKPDVPLAGNRRWEKTTKGSSLADPSPFEHIPNLPSYAPDPSRLSDESVPSSVMSPRFSQSKNGDASSVLSSDKSSPSVSPSCQSLGPLNGSHTSHSQFRDGALEHPAITLFRRDKVVELLQRCTLAVTLVGERITRRVIYRWIVRATHGKAQYSDPIIPSWIDSDQLVAYFQRQFIAESRRLPNSPLAGPSVESLREAGLSVSVLCQNLAKQVVSFRHRIDEQLLSDWTDAALGMAATDGTLTGSAAVVTVSWANRAQVFIPTQTYATLRDRFAGPPSRFLAAAFVARVLYETTQLIVTDTNMDARLSPKTQTTLASEAGVAAELWSDPFTALSSNVFWGHFEHVDALFGGQKPFGKDDHGSEEILARHGGSLSAFLPLDAMVSSQYMQRMVDILDSASAASVPVSFAVFLGAECFHDLSNMPTSSDLLLLDPRLGEQQSAYITRVVPLHARQHAFFGGEGAGMPKVIPTDSLFVLLQNDPGQQRYHVGDTAVSRILATIFLSNPSHNDTVIASSMGLTGDFQRRDSPLSHQPGYFDGVDAITPDPQRVVRSDFGAIGGAPLSSTFSPVNDGFPRGSRRGRLFDLVDDGEEEHDDIMSGMLNNLDVGFFHNANVGSDNVDIEAISLMGIGGPPRSLGNLGHTNPGRLG